MPDPGGYWDLGVGGWMWYPPDRAYYVWDLWYPGPSGYAGFGSYGWGCSYPYAWSSFLATGMGWWVAGYPSYGSYGYGDRYGYAYDSYYRDIALLGRLPPRAIGTRYPDRPDAEADAPPPRAFIDPVRTESLDRTLWTGPGTEVLSEADGRQPRASIDPVRSEALDRTLWTKPGEAVRRGEPDPGTRVRSESDGGRALSRPSPEVTAKELRGIPTGDRELRSEKKTTSARPEPERSPGLSPARDAGRSDAQPVRSPSTPKAITSGPATRQPASEGMSSRPGRPVDVAQPTRTGGKKNREP